MACNQAEFQTRVTSTLPIRSGIFREISKWHRPAPFHLAMNIPPMLAELSFSSAGNRHPQGATAWTLRNGLCPSSAWERKCSTAGATAESSCRCNTPTEGPPLSDHLLVQCWGNLHCRPHFWPAGIQPYSYEFIQKLAKASVRSDVGSTTEVFRPKERWMGILKIKLHSIREYPVTKPDIFHEKRTSLAKLCVNGQ